MMWRKNNVKLRVSLSLAAVAVAAPALMTSAPVAVAQSGDLAAVQRHLQQTESMTAAFTQTDRAGKVLTGTMTLKKPGKIRFQYQQGVPYLIVADGRNLYFLDYQVRQQQRWPIGDSPLGVLIDPRQDITRYAKVVPGTDPRVLTVEAHDPKRPQYGRITMIFARDNAAPGGLRLQGWVALDSQNNRTTIRLSDQKFNVAVNDRTFRWNDPRRGGRPG